MTIAALHRLLNEIDDQGGPTAARHNRLHLPDPEGTPEPMTTTASPAHTIAGLPLPTAPQPAEPQPIPVGQLLKWGDEHDDPDVRDQAARARAALTGLRNRHAVDQELSAITTEREQLERRLQELNARETELAPAKAKKAPKRDYDPATVRAWAQQAGVDCPERGRVPKAVVDAWREANRQAGAETS